MKLSLSRGHTLSRRFAAAFVLVVAIPSVVVAIVLSRLYLSALHDTAIRQADLTAEQVAGHIRDDTDNVALLAAALMHDEELRGLAGVYAAASTRRDVFVASRRLDEKLVGFFRYTRQVGAIMLFLKSAPGPALPATSRGGMGKVAEPHLPLTGKSYVYSNYPNLRGIGSVGREVYAEAQASPGRVFLVDRLDGVAGNVGARHMITLAVCPPPQEDTPIEAILVSFRMPYLDELVDRWGSEPGSALVLYGRTGQPLLSTLPEPPQASLAAFTAAPPHEVQAGGRTWLATAYPVGSAGWRLLLLADRAALGQRVTRYQWYLYPALAVLGIVFLAYAEFFFARIAAPIRRVVGHMGAVSRGDLAVRAEPQQIAELAELTQGFNAMVQRIDELGVARERSERERLAVELDALRYQINPHFVANTLNAIRFMALAARAEAIAAMTRDLTRLLADSYAGAEKLVALSRELDNVKAYAGIMKVRYGERFALALEVANGTEHLLSLRMILQPIVENAILHGLAAGAPQPGRGVVRIRTWVEADPDASVPLAAEPWARAVAGLVLMIEVRDDGRGMEPGLPARLLDEPSQANGLYRIGVANVHRRIRLNFGEPYGLCIDSEPGAYTAVRYRLPVFERAPCQTGPHPAPYPASHPQPEPGLSLTQELPHA